MSNEVGNKHMLNAPSRIYIFINKTQKIRSFKTKLLRVSQCKKTESTCLIRMVVQFNNSFYWIQMHIEVPRLCCKTPNAGKQVYFIKISFENESCSQGKNEAFSTTF